MSFNVFKILPHETSTTFRKVGKIKASNINKAISRAKNKFRIKELVLSTSSRIKEIPLYPKWCPISLESSLNYFNGNGTTELLAG